MSRARVLFSTLPIYQIVQLISRFSNSFDTPQQADNDGANGRLPLESPKKCPDFGKKGPDGVHLWIKFTIQNVFLTVSRRKISKFFPYGVKVSRLRHFAIPKCRMYRNYMRGLPLFQYQ